MLDSGCCSPVEQPTCCEPDAKDACCGESHGSGCGFAAGKAHDLSNEDVHRVVLEQYTEAARVALAAPVLEAFAGRSEYSNSGHRVVAGQRLMQAAGDIFLGWMHVVDPDGVERDFYVRQLRDWKGSAEIEEMGLFRSECGERDMSSG
jgi:hypothetical protein